MSDYSGRFLFPRLPIEIAKGLAADVSTRSLPALRSEAAVSHLHAAPNAVGGLVAPEKHIRAVTHVVRELADDFNFPAPMSQVRQAEFDRLCGTLLLREMQIITADAGVRDVWSFMTLVALPEIGVWRFPNTPAERLLGGTRNTLQRLWWRAWSLGPDLTQLPDSSVALGEDDYVQIMERPTISGNRRIAQSLQKAIWMTSVKDEPFSRSELVREFTKMLRARRSHLSFDSLNDEALNELVAEICAATVGRLRAR